MLDKFKQIAKKVKSSLNSRRTAALMLFVVGAIAVMVIGTASGTVAIYDGDNIITVKTFHSDTDAILAQAGVAYSAEDEVSLSTVSSGYRTLTLNRAFDVTITAGSEVYNYRTTGGTVEDALSALDITVDEHDVLSAELTDELRDNRFIDLLSVDYEIVTEDVAISYDTKTEYSASLPEGQTKVVEGEEGLKQVIYRNKLVNGTLAETTTVEETVVKTPVAKTTLVGTKAGEDKETKTNTATPPKAEAVKTSSSVKTISSLQPSTEIALDASGRPVSYKKLITGRATAYTARDGAKTATGRIAQTGYVAVNPNQIPYGTKLYIKSSDGSYMYGYAIAADTGGFAKKGKTTIDLYFNTNAECLRFGARTVEIYVLD